MAKYDYNAEGVNSDGQSISNIMNQLQDHFNQLLKASAPLQNGQAWRGVGQEDFAQDLAQLQQEFNNLDSAIQSFLTALSVVRDQADATLNSCNGIANSIDVAAV